MKKFDLAGFRKKESGNVLFLILIAVALFAALSYAVTQSSRSGGGDANSEKSLVSSSEVTQYPAGIRTSILRMIVSNGVTADQLEFDPPSSFAPAAGATITAANQAVSVFHPAGGGGTYQQATPEMMASGTAGSWHFNGHFQIPQIGTTSADNSASGNDIVAFLRGVSKSVCQKVDTQLGIGTVPVIGAPIAAADLDLDQVASAAGSTTSTFDTINAGADGLTTLTGTGIDGQPFACFNNGTLVAPEYVYYHVLIER